MLRDIREIFREGAPGSPLLSSKISALFSLPFLRYTTSNLDSFRQFNNYIISILSVSMFPMAGHSVQRIWTGFGVRPS